MIAVSEFQTFLTDKLNQVSPAAAFAWIMLGTLISEDFTLLVSSGIMSTGRLPPWLIIWSNVAGITLGNVLLYGIGRLFGNHADRIPFVKKALTKERLDLGRETYAKWGLWILVIVRFVPGTRMPAYVSAGMFRAPLGWFILIVTIVGLLWVVALSKLIAAALVSHNPWPIVAIVAAIAILRFAYLQLKSHPRWRAAFYRVASWRHFEFWSPWFFYAPVLFYYLWLGIRYRSFLLPTLANPGIPTGGLIGESKHDTLEHLRAKKEFRLASAVLRAADASERPGQLRDFVQNAGLHFPLILKPDVGQRGSGVRLVASVEEANRYLTAAPYDVLAQEYCAFPFEIGVYYCRRPNEAAGRILSITEKIFPSVVGDGRRTLRELVLADPRARFMSRVYLARYPSLARVALAEGEKLKLVEVGNHAQGAVFLNGIRLRTPALERRIDEIAQSIPGFFVGRFDLRFDSEAELKSGRAFKIIEVNGAAGEATHIYDARGTLGAAYKSLFGQVRVLFEIGNDQRKRGLKPTRVREFLRLLTDYRRQSKFHPRAS